MSAPDGGNPAAAPRGGRWRRIVLWLVPGVVVAILASATYRAHWRAQHDPTFCAGSCHTRTEPSGAPGSDWHLKGHANLECQKCHTTSTVKGLELWLTGAETRKVVEHGRVEAKTCTSCHQTSAVAWASISMTQGHREHRTAKNVDCLSCHAKTTHAAEPPEKACLKCHENQRLHKATTAAEAETCLSCHTYAATSKSTRPPTTTTCERCHADATKLASSVGAAGASTSLRPVNEHVLHGAVACQLCHNAHGKKAKPPDGQPICVKCHQFEPFQAGAIEKKGPEGHRNCEGCHQPHAPLKTAVQSCVNCHEKNAKGLTSASAGVHAGVGAGASGGAGTTSALKHDSCASCHLPHTWRAERSGCIQCHEEKASLVLTRSPAAHSACTSCHQVHGPPPNGGVCVSCHAKTKGNHVALAPERHKSCTSCHNPHAPKAQDTRSSCTKCHTTQVTQVTRDGPEGHTACFDCHKPHDNPRPPADVCAKCHAERAKVVATASPPKHRTCASCHEQHKFKIRDVATACAKCHGPIIQAATTEQGKTPHQGECKSCHALHGSPGIPRASCLKCHEKVAAELNAPNDKHANCRSCHQPHKPVSTARTSCATCHEAKAAIAAKWPASSAHAKACNTCHKEHDVRNKKTCASCHAQETASAMGGRHQCSQCHAPHKAPPGTGSAWWSRCTECHAAKVESVKLRGPTHSDCKNCHQPHQFAVPGCTSCHKDMASKGLHAVDQHAANCKACHDPHVAAAPTPPQCLSCHTNRRGHEPNTQQCQACHMFK